MSFPYYFQPLLCPVTGHYLSDGGVISNYPLFLLSEYEQKNTLSFLINSGIASADDLGEQEIERIIIRPIRMALMAKQKLEEKFYKAKSIEICLDNLNILEFSFNEETKNLIIERGKAAVIKYFKEPKKLERRHSVS